MRPARYTRCLRVSCGTKEKASVSATRAATPRQSSKATDWDESFLRKRSSPNSSASTPSDTAAPAVGLTQKQPTAVTTAQAAAKSALLMRIHQKRDSRGCRRSGDEGKKASSGGGPCGVQPQRIGRHLLRDEPARVAHIDRRRSACVQQQQQQGFWATEQMKWRVAAVVHGRQQVRASIPPAQEILDSDQLPLGDGTVQHTAAFRAGAREQRQVRTQ
eukprot:scaffold250_cov110-Isochrysis_galbana.AAC.10